MNGRCEKPTGPPVSEASEVDLSVRSGDHGAQISIVSGPETLGGHRVDPSSLWLKGRKGSTRLIPRTTLPHGHEST